MSKGKLLLFALLVLMFVAYGHVETAKAFHAVNRGYFRDLSEGGGWWDVWAPAWDGWGGVPWDCGGGNGQAIPYGVDTADEFLNFVQCKLNGGTRDHVGAAFMLWTMTGTGDMGELTRRVKYAESRGWFQMLTLSCNPYGSLPRNTFYQPSRADVAWYWGCPLVSNYPGGPYYYPATYSAIAIYNGSDWYIIARFCANPIGNMPRIADDPVYNLTPSIRVEVNGSTVAGNYAQIGDTVSFIYRIYNGDAGVANSRCWYYQATHPGYSTATAGGGYAPPGASCTPNVTVQPWDTATVGVDSFVVSAGNVSYCRRIDVDPVTPAGGTRSANGCAHIVTKPYSRVYGGDVIVGTGVGPAATPNSCTAYNTAAIVGWNRRAGGAYAGAGVQHAAFALSRIFDTATSSGNTGGVAPPTGLSFANTSTAPASGLFGGVFGSAPCITDYYARRPNPTLSIPVGPDPINQMTTGIYGANTDTYLSGLANINPNERITLYVDGNLHLNANVMYTGSWSASSIPNFQVVVRGNIYIDRGVTRLDGVYIAQPRTDGSRGFIYTCASGLYTAAPTNGSLGPTCRNKLTVNGSFIAKQVHLLRTGGTVQQSGIGEGSGSANIAEVFNYNPAFWIPRPAGSEVRDGYDAITSLPPIL